MFSFVRRFFKKMARPEVFLLYTMLRFASPGLREICGIDLNSEDAKTMRTIPIELFYKPVFPIEIGLHIC
jgi:hypothetical protein